MISYMYIKPISRSCDGRTPQWLTFQSSLFIRGGFKGKLEFEEHTVSPIKKNIFNLSEPFSFIQIKSFRYYYSIDYIMSITKNIR